LVHLQAFVVSLTCAAVPTAADKRANIKNAIIFSKTVLLTRCD